MPDKKKIRIQITDFTQMVELSITLDPDQQKYVTRNELEDQLIRACATSIQEFLFRINLGRVEHDLEIHHRAN